MWKKTRTAAVNTANETVVCKETPLTRIYFSMKALSECLKKRWERVVTGQLLFTCRVRRSNKQMSALWVITQWTHVTCNMKQECLVFLSSSHDMMMGMTHAEHAHTHKHTHTRFKGLTHPPHHSHPLPTSMSWLFGEKQFLGKRKRERGRLNTGFTLSLRPVIVPEKGHGRSACKISTAHEKLLPHRVKRWARPVWAAGVRELWEFNVALEVLPCLIYLRCAM